MIATGTIRRARRRVLLKRVVTICVTLVVAAGLAVVWVRVVQTLKAPSNAPKAVGQPGSLVWDGRVFESPRQLKAYLNAKGLSYSRWAARHPTAFGAAPPPAKHTTRSRKKAPSKPTTRRVAVPAGSTTHSRSLISTALTTLLLLVGLAMAGSAVMPPRLAPVALQRFYAVPDRRMFVFAAATAILLGFGVSFYLT